MGNSGPRIRADSSRIMLSTKQTPPVSLNASQTDDSVWWLPVPLGFDSHQCALNAPHTVHSCTSPCSFLEELLAFTCIGLIAAFTEDVPVLSTSLAYGLYMEICSNLRQRADLYSRMTAVVVLSNGAFVHLDKLRLPYNIGQVIDLHRSKHTWFAQVLA
ncbi:hypothetical protein POTOM_029436 [Populus tomentosa]|uniref:Uncharacterized protein n=1 Tax=Populus tomentosa TaxID=118781 RepID=A0A8X8CJN5_POPTO|nr:hypothetical protein POTOM_029436 [Populus tomentosa]